MNRRSLLSIFPFSLLASKASASKTPNGGEDGYHFSFRLPKTDKPMRTSFSEWPLENTEHDMFFGAMCDDFELYLRYNKGKWEVQPMSCRRGFYGTANYKPFTPEEIRWIEGK